jgi:hypothetical protein
VIRINRPPKAPRKLAAQRRKGLKRAFSALNAYGVGSNELKEALKDYDGGKKVLFLKQHKKCAFCERRSVLSANSLEHFRPKGVAWRHLPKEKPARIDPGYWWLTWTWENHLFSCHACNTGPKKSFFPLTPGSVTLPGPTAPYKRKRLQPAHVQTAVETPLLIDPAAEDPLDHIQWKPINPKQARSLWKWSPKDLTPEGKATILVLGLLKQVDIVGNHLRDNVLARADAICALIDGGQHTQAQAQWLALANDVVRSDCDLAGPTWNALHYLVDEKRRHAAGLLIPPRP